MADVTDADRRTAVIALFPELARVGYIDGLTFSDEAEVDIHAIATALAEEREKARAPFRALAERMRTLHKGEEWDGEGIADCIDEAAEEAQ